MCLLLTHSACIGMNHISILSDTSGSNEIVIVGTFFLSGAEWKNFQSRIRIPRMPRAEGFTEETRNFRKSGKMIEEKMRENWNIFGIPSLAALRSANIFTFAGLGPNLRGANIGCYSKEKYQYRHDFEEKHTFFKTFFFIPYVKTK